MQQSYRTKAIVLFGFLALALGFQNCSRAIYQIKGLGSGNNSRFNGALGGVPLIQILGGATVTNTVNITLDIQSAGTNSMYITSDSTCATGANWIPQTPTHPYILLTTNAMNFIYGKFKDASGNETSCVSAQILHDDLSPTIQYVSTPPALSPSATANFEYLGNDSGSGLSHYECRLVPAVFATCNSTHILTGLPDGSHTFEVRAVDNGGNRSAPLPYTWIVDTTKPTVMITSGPSPLSSSSTAQFAFQGNDGAGSGIAGYRCAVDAVIVNPCVDPHSISGLAEGNHVFDVWAIDRAGNVSDPAHYNWEVDSVVPGDFMVSGVTAPPVDTIVDSWLGGRTPTVHWTPSDRAIQYRVMILNQTGTMTLCGPVTTNSLTYAFPGSCLLAPASRNIARVEALTRSGAVLRRDLAFRVDSSAPIITLVGPKVIDPAVKAEFDLTVVDDGDLDSVTCSHYHGANVTTVSCLNQPIVKFDQPMGTNRLVVVAKDAAGNRSEKELIWVVKSCSCNPFDPSGSDCGDEGLRGEIYYLTGPQIIDFETASPAWPDRSVYYIINNGVRTPTDLRMADLSVSTRIFDTGFPIGDGNFLKNERGETLIEFFAFRLNGYLKLGLPSVKFPAPADATGHYQLALLSDDGAVMRVRTSSAATPEILLNNDGYHPTKFKCATKTIEMKADTKVQVMLDYFQGPRTHISLMLLWRKVDPSAPGALNDPLCNVEGNETFFGPSYTDFSAAYGYGQLLNRGWKVPVGRNYQKLSNTP